MKVLLFSEKRTDSSSNGTGGVVALIRIKADGGENVEFCHFFLIRKLEMGQFACTGDL